MEKRQDSVLRRMNKDNLISYINKLEEIIGKYDKALAREYTYRELAITFIKSPQFRKKQIKTLIKILEGTVEMWD